MSLLDHAWRELRLSGTAQRDPELAAAVMTIVGVAAGLMRADAADPVDLAEPVARLLRNETLTPLSRDPGEWDDRSGPTGRALWQNRRNPKAFSEDGGRTYFLVHERQQFAPHAPPVYEAAPARQRGGQGRSQAGL